MKTAAEYAELVEKCEDPQWALVYATQQVAAAILEAAGPPWPEASTAMEDQYAPCAVPEEHRNGKPHRCTMAHPHPNDPHYCKCGSEL